MRRRKRKLGERRDGGGDGEEEERQTRAEHRTKNDFRSHPVVGATNRHGGGSPVTSGGGSSLVQTSEPEVTHLCPHGRIQQHVLALHVAKNDIS